METLEYTLESEQQFWDGISPQTSPHVARVLIHHEFQSLTI
jgi:hypothetical protein